MRRKIMSGGSWDYLCFKVGDAARDLEKDPVPYRRAFGKHLSLIANALHDIEWVDSNDKSPGDDKMAIMKCIKNDHILNELVDDAITIRDNINELLAKLEERK